MATISEHIAAIRIQIRKYEDDTPYGDQLIFHYLSQAAGTLNRQRANKHAVISDWDFKYFCVPLEKAELNVCPECTPAVMCKVLKSTFKIPRPLMKKNRALIDVRKFDGESIPPVGMDKEVQSYDPVLSRVEGYAIKNGYLIVFNNLRLPKLEVGGLWEDVTKWAGYNSCGESGTESCFDLDSDEFPIDSSLSLVAYEMVVTSLGIKMQPENQNQPH